MQFERGRHLGADASNNAGFVNYDAVYTQCIADNAISVNEAVLMATDATVATAANVGYAVETTASGDNNRVVGRADSTAAVGDYFLVQCYGVGSLISDGTVTVAETLGTDATTAGRVQQHAAVPAAQAGVMSQFAVALESQSTAGSTFLAFIRCM